MDYQFEIFLLVLKENKSEMKKISTVLIFIISGTILNVWLFRLHKPTSFRGNDASTLMEEFLVYGLDKNLFYIVGIVKVITSILLLFGIIKKKLVIPTASIIALIMVVALLMHFRVGDSFYKHIPALIIFTMSTLLVLIERKLIKF